MVSLRLLVVELVIYLPPTIVDFFDWSPLGISRQSAKAHLQFGYLSACLPIEMAKES